MRKFKHSYYYDILACISLIIASIVMFYNVPYISGLMGDTGEAFYAVVTSNARYLANGEFPLWNPSFWQGVPNTGYLYQMFYPIMQILLLIFFNKETQFLSYHMVEAYFIIHFIIISIGFYFLARQLTKNRIICFCIPLLCIFSGAFMMIGGWFAVISGYSYVPYLIGFFILMAKTEGKKSWLYTMGIGFSIAFTGISAVTHGLLWLLSTFAVLYSFYIWENRKDKKCIKDITMKCLLGGFIGMAWCAIQLLPTIEFMSLTYRWGLSTESASAISGMSFADFTQHSTTISDAREIFASARGWLSLGIPLVISVIAGFFTKAKKYNYILNLGKFLFIFALLYTLNIFVTDIIWYIPFLNSIREPFLYTSLFAIGAGIVGVFGMQSIFAYIKDRTINFYAPSTLVFLISIVCIFLVLPHNISKFGTPLIPIILISAIILILFKKINSYRIIAVMMVCVSLLNFSGLRTSFSIGKYTVSEANQQFEVINDKFSAIVDKLGQPTKQDPYRILQWTKSKVYPSNELIRMGIWDSMGYVNPSYRKAVEIHGAFNLNKRMVIQNIKYLVQSDVDGEGFLSTIPDLKESVRINNVPLSYDSEDTNTMIAFENINRQGMAWMTYDLIPYKNDTSLEELAEIVNSQQFQPHTMALVNIDKCKNFKQTSKGNISKTTVLDSGANFFKVSVENDNAGMLVTSESDYPGWNVYVDGKKTQISEVNYGSKGVWLEPGNHIVEFKFMPPLFILGLFLALVSLGVCTAIVAIYFKEPKKNNLS